VRGRDPPVGGCHEGVSVERAGRDDVFNRLCGGPAGAACGKIRAKFGRVQPDEGVARDEPDEGGENLLTMASKKCTKNLLASHLLVMYRT
jgi:hypothetical protein